MFIKLMGLNPDIGPRLMSRVTITDTCWLWTGNVNDKGYGYIKNYGKREKVHRVAYVLAWGDIPDGIKVDHECRVKNCVRPAHLRLVTNKQNMENQGSRAGSLVPYRGVTRVWKARLQAYKYIGRVYHNGTCYYCGTYPTAEAANEACIAKRNELYTHNTGENNSYCIQQR